ncbi:MAG: threonine--tRNA ligase [Candidatus Omnitrophica bacterium]|nr:threonine--tRNA ligase [Candidatus Omnitrophota bacterium]
MSKKPDEQLQTLRHSAAHIMADAVQRLFPGTKLGIGPAIDDGFYYDFDSPTVFTPEDLPRIEEEMAKVIKEGAEFKKRVLSRDEARDLFGSKGEKYKVELLDALDPSEEISVYSHGAFTDLCRGPHIETANKVKAFKLLTLAGAYWKGSEKNAMLQRIYGTAFMDRDALKTYITLREEAAKRDHRKLGKELDLFSFNDAAGAGLVIYHPKGAMLRMLIAEYITKKHIEKGYELISSPQILKSDIWVRSGHYGYYKENMYIFESDDTEYAVKPMNCPGHIIVYASQTRSYREFPIRYFELGHVHRHEKSGVLHGLLRVRGFTQDDAHLFCLPEQVETEICAVMDFVKETLLVFGFKEFEVELSTRPEKSIGSDEMWEQATRALRNSLEKNKIPYEINEGDGAFYGPKIDIKLKDALSRSWQCATIQCDFALPERFDLKYVDSDGKEKRPIMLHRVILGSLERFIGALIEQYAGAFPLWLAPVQVKVIPIAEAHFDYAVKIKELLTVSGFRVELDLRSEKFQKKIRDAELAKIPYMAVVGAKEMEDGTVAVRSKKRGQAGVVNKTEFVEQLRKEVEQKADL